MDLDKSGGFLGFLFGCAIGFGMIVGMLLAPSGGDVRMCRQWAGETAIIYESKCMVPTESGGLRPARRDE